MCELLGMVSSVPADLDLLVHRPRAARRPDRAARRRLGPRALRRQDSRARFWQPDPAFSSPLARFVRENPILTPLAIAHIRKMTRGQAAIQNTHPFVRVFDGRHLVFAHNGTLPHVRDRQLRFDSPIGDTDSEHAFCVILDTMRARYGARYPEDPLDIGRLLFDVANDLGSDGVFNFCSPTGTTCTRAAAIISRPSCAARRSDRRRWSTPTSPSTWARRCRQTAPPTWRSSRPNR